MTFNEILSQTIAMLQQHGRVSFRMLKRQFDLDDDDLEDLKYELIEIQKCVVDQDNKMLVWAGDTETALSPPTAVPVSAPTSPPQNQDRDPVSYTPQYLAEKILTSRSTLEGERKQVTVMFADIKDSTELIRDLDPEAAQQLLDPAIHIMMDAVHRFEGTVNQVLGDGIMAIFGAPISHEDHAARACFAALAMQTAMQPYADEVLCSHGITMQIRVGLNSGEVVVRTIGNDLHMDYSAVGPTTHLAARMEQIALPGSVTLSSSTLRLVEGLIRVNERGPVPVKGMSEPVEVYELNGASTVKRRLQAAVARGLTKFVGRDTEIEALNQALERAKAGNGQVVAAIGEAGLGKSRLFYEFIQSHRTQGWRVLESASVSYGKATPYFPLVDLLKRYAHVEEGDDVRTIRAKLTGQVLTLDETLHEITPALLALCDVLPNDHPFVQLDPPQHRQHTLDGLKRLLLRESQAQPLLLVFEDLHWIDSETQALLDRLVDGLPTSRMLLLVNYRPEYQHGWGSKTYYTQLRLDPLQPESAEAFLTVLLGDDPGLEPLKKLLIERTDGNPFFLEESVRALVETRALDGEPGAYCLVRELPAIQVPATVQAILAARIDRLPSEVKQLLQSAAVIGTEVSLPLLQALAELPADVLHDGLPHLQAAEFLYETQLFPEHEYTFKHALTHEVAYSSLLQERRRVLHARIVDALESLGGDRLPEQVERLAHHALRGEVWDKAVTYFHQAGTRAMAGSAHQEAVVYFEQALDALQHLPDSHDTVAQGIDLCCNLRNALLPLGEYERIIDKLREAEQLAEGLDDPYRLRLVYSQLTHYFWSMRNLDPALVYGQRALALADSLGDYRAYVGANFVLAEVYYSLGNYGQAIAAFGQNVARLTGDRLHERFGPAVLSVVSRRWLVQALAETGAFAEGIAWGEEAIRIAEAADHPYSLANACLASGYLYVRKGDVQKAIPLFERGLELCRAWDMRQFVTGLTLILGHALTLSGQVSTALPLLELLLAQDLSTSMASYMGGHGFVWLSEAYLLAGRLAEAKAWGTRALDESHESKEHGTQSWALRLLGDISMRCDSPDTVQGETHYRQALALGGELDMHPLQAHCHRGLGALYRQTGQSEQARAELSTAIEMYRNMEMTFWLPETEAVLADVEGKA